MKKLLLIFTLLSALFSVNGQTIRDYSVKDITTDYNVWFRPFKTELRVRVSGDTITPRQFLGNVHVDTFARAVANRIFAVTNLNNTSDLNKPLSTAVINAFSLKANSVNPSFSGNTGFSTTASRAKLEIAGGLNAITSLATTVSSESFLLSDGGNLGLTMGITTGSGGMYPTYLQARHNNGISLPYPILLNPLGGNVGINTTTPAYQFSVNGISNTSQLIVNNTVNSGEALQVTGTTKLQNTQILGTGLTITVAGNTSNAIVFQDTNTGGNNWLTGPGIGTGLADGFSLLYTTTGIGTVMYAKTNGYVGIGTMNPTSKLQVVGIQPYADNTAATAAGLTVGAFYRTSTGVLMVVF